MLLVHLSLAARARPAHHITSHHVCVTLACLPTLRVRRAPAFADAVDMAHQLIMFGGPGHTSVLYTNPLNSKHIAQFSNAVKTVRILINTPASQGAIGRWWSCA